MIRIIDKERIMAYLFDSNGVDPKQNGNLPADPAVAISGYQYFKQRLHEEVLRSQRRQHPFTLIRLALQSPTEHPVEQIARLLESSVREYDLVCHVESNHFAIVLPETAQPFAPKIAARICRAVSENVPQGNTRVGIAYFPSDGTNAEDLLDSAEQDLNRD
jgi:diguanylate cyclase with GGDEF domain